MAKFSGTSTAVIVFGDGAKISLAEVAAISGALYAETKDLDLGLPSYEKYVDRVIFDLEALQDVPALSVALGYRNSLSEPLVWLSPQTLVFPDPQITPRIQAKFFRLRFNDDLPIVQWKLSRIEFYGHVCGGRFA